MTEDEKTRDALEMAEYERKKVYTESEAYRIAESVMAYILAEAKPNGLNADALLTLAEIAGLARTRNVNYWLNEEWRN